MKNYDKNGIGYFSCFLLLVVNAEMTGSDLSIAAGGSNP